MSSYQSARSNRYFAGFTVLAILMAIPAPIFLLAPEQAMDIMYSWEGLPVILFLWFVISILLSLFFLYECGIKKAFLFFLIGISILEILAIHAFTLKVLLSNPLAEGVLFLSAVALAGALSIPFDFLDNFKDQNVR